MGLITDPNEAKAEITLDEAATKNEVMKYVANHFQKTTLPAFITTHKRLDAIEKQYNLGANVVNNLIDFLEIEGFQVQKDGRIRLNAQEFNAFVKKRALGNQTKQPPTDA